VLEVILLPGSDYFDDLKMIKQQHCDKSHKNGQVKRDYFKAIRLNHSVQKTDHRLAAERIPRI